MSKGVLREIKEWVLSIIIAAIVAFVIKGFLIDIIQVSGTSMLPNLSDKDRLVIEKISLYTHNYKRGEIIIFKPNDVTKDIYIKRIVGLPGDKVEIKNGEVYVNNEKLDESYLKPDMFTGAEPNQFSNLIVPDNCLYVLGDNRVVSEDSRYIGPIPIENIKGHAVLRVYPFNQTKKF
jgi:signal peptidase I